MKIKVKCDWCNKELLIIPFHAKWKHHFCNRACAGKFQSHNAVGEKSYNWKGGEIKTKCCFCKKNIYIMRCKYLKNKNRFCNKKCHSEFMKKYQRRENHPCWQGGPVNEKCKWCNKIFRRRRNGETKFCGRKCMGKFQSENCIGERNYNYIHGECMSSYPSEFNEKRKEFIRRRDDHKCQNCGVSQKDLLRALDVHHIDYNKKNNDGINLISLCKHCHMKSNGNRKYWKNYYEQIQIDRRVHLLDMKLEMEEKIE